VRADEPNTTSITRSTICSVCVRADDPGLALAVLKAIDHLDSIAENSSCHSSAFADDPFTNFITPSTSPLRACADVPSVYVTLLPSGWSPRVRGSADAPHFSDGAASVHQAHGSLSRSCADVPISTVRGKAIVDRSDLRSDEPMMWRPQPLQVQAPYESHG